VAIGLVWGALLLAVGWRVSVGFIGVLGNQSVQFIDVGLESS
jgi:hypothetical protein